MRYPGASSALNQIYDYKGFFEQTTAMALDSNVNGEYFGLTGSNDDIIPLSKWNEIMEYCSTNKLALVLNETDGAYCFEETPQLFFPHVPLIGRGMPIIRQMGDVDYVAIFGRNNKYYYGGYLSNFIFEGTEDNRATLNGLMVDGLVHTTIGYCRARNVGLIGFDDRSSVMNFYQSLTVSTNVDDSGEYGAASTGIKFSPSSNPEFPSRPTDNLIVACKFEGILGTGIQFVNCDNNQVICGTSEANYRGVDIGSTSQCNELLGLACEVNQDGDVLDNGRRTRIVGGYYASYLPDETPSIEMGDTCEAPHYQDFRANVIKFNNNCVNPHLTHIYARLWVYPAPVNNVKPVLDFRYDEFSTASWLPGRSFGNYNDPNNTVLDYYEHGVSFQPTLGGSSSDGALTYTANSGFCTRIGNVCYFNLTIVIDNDSNKPTGNLIIKNLPFPIPNNNVTSMSIGQCNLTMPPGGFTMYSAYTGVDSINLAALFDSNASAPIPATSAVSGGRIILSGFYWTR